jgi:hypothetical protein
MVLKEEIVMAKQGWVCPKCGTPLAPHVAACIFCQNGGDKKVSDTAPETVKELFGIKGMPSATEMGAKITENLDKLKVLFADAWEEIKKKALEEAKKEEAAKAETAPEENSDENN